MSPQIVYPEKGVRPWAHITGAVGDMPPSRKTLPKRRKNGKNHTKIEKFVIRTPNQAFIQDFDPGMLAEPKGCQ